MKTVEMDRDFNYSPHENTTIAYKKGRRYERVPEAAVDAIKAAGAGRVLGEKAAAVKKDEDAGR